MDLLIVRHGLAGDREEFAKEQPGASDDLRPLTRKGKKQMAKSAKGLVDLVPSIDHLFASPLVRARETAAIVAEAYDRERPEITDVLRPDCPVQEFLTWAQTLGNRSVLAVVGHEPHLSHLITWLVAGTRDSRVQL